MLIAKPSPEAQAQIAAIDTFVGAPLTFRFATAAMHAPHLSGGAE